MLTQYRREIATTTAVLATLLTVGKLAPIGTHDVVIARREIPVGTQIQAADLGTVKSRSWPQEVRDPVDLIGKIPNHSIPAGGLLTRADIVGESSLPPGLVQVVIALSNSEIQIVSGGMHLDIYSPGGLVANDVIVVSVSKKSSDSFLASSNQASAVVAVSPSQVPALALAKESSTLTIALRSTN